MLVAMFIFMIVSHMYQAALLIKLAYKARNGQVPDKKKTKGTAQQPHCGENYCNKILRTHFQLKSEGMRGIYAK